MYDAEAERLLAWALPLRGLRWRGFRRNRRQVYRRLRLRIAELRLAGFDAYRARLAKHPDEWAVLESLCRVTISRFGRDREMWTVLVDDVLPKLAAARLAIRAWSAGCGAGEEPFTLAIAWALEIAPRWPSVALDVLATDVDDTQLARAAVGRFPAGSLRELPDGWRAAAFDERGGEATIRAVMRAPVRFGHHDLRTPPPSGPFDLVLCRNLAYSYFDEPTQGALTASLRAVMRAGSVLVVGGDERLTATRDFVLRSHGIYVAR
jgi:chemotaxis protein methyltransferase CheR